MDAAERLIVALDYQDRASAMRLVDKLEGTVSWYKVGLQLYLAEGRALVEELRTRGYDVFLDLKLHDIPHTVAGAVQSVVGCGAGLLTIHASGGSLMMDAAVDAAAKTSDAPRLLAVTVLTSMSQAQLNTIGVAGDLSAHVLRLGQMALQSGVDGLVCSAHEIQNFRAHIAADALLVVPGIRSANATQDDQQRTATATEAIQWGASMLVIGRPITQAADPAVAADLLLREIAAAI